MIKDCNILLKENLEYYQKVNAIVHILDMTHSQSQKNVTKQTDRPTDQPVDGPTDRVTY